MPVIEITHPSDIRRLLTAAKRCSCEEPPLKKSSTATALQIDFTQTTDLPEEAKILQATDLATLVAAFSGRLGGLRLFGVGINGDISVLASALSNHGKTVEEIAIDGEKTSVDHLTTLGTAISKLPTLKVLRLHRLPPASLWKISNAFVPSPKSKIESITTQARMSIEMLMSYSEESENDARRFFAACASLPCLSKLEIWVVTIPVEAITQMLSQSSSIQRLSLTTRTSNSNPSMATIIAKSLEQNQSLTSLYIYCSKCGPQPEEAEAFHAALKDNNFVLTHLGIPEACRLAPANPNAVQLLRHHKEAIKFYLTLNKLGRARLIGSGEEVQATSSEWMEAISDQEDASVIYYFLRRNPSLCLPDKQDGAKQGHVYSHDEDEDLKADGECNGVAPSA